MSSTLCDISQIFDCTRLATRHVLAEQSHSPTFLNLISLYAAVEETCNNIKLYMYFFAPEPLYTLQKMFG